MLIARGDLRQLTYYWYQSRGRVISQDGKKVRFVGFDPAKDVGVVVLTNSGHGADDIGFHLVNPASPLAPAPTKRTEIEVAEEILAS